MSEIEIAKQSARGSLLLFVGSVLSTFVLAVSTIIIARLLGPDSYGAYTLVLLVPSLFQNLIGFGVGVAITRFSAYYVSQGKKDVAKSFIINGSIFLAVFGVALTLVSVFASQYLSVILLHRQGLGPLISYVSIIILTQTILQSSVSALIGWNSMGTVSFTQILQAALRLAVSVTLVVLGFGIFGALTGNILSSILTAAVALVALYVFKLRRMNREGGQFYKDVREMVSYGLPLYTGNVISTFASQLVTIILATIAVNAIVGNYQAAVNVTAVIGLASSAITLALLPAFASLDGIGANTGLALAYSVKYVAYVVSPTIFCLVGTADLFVRLLYGASYSQAGFYLELYSLSYLPIIIGYTVVSVFFSGVGKTRITMVLNLLGAAALLVLAPLLGAVLNFGVAGLIFASMFSNLVAAVAGLILARRHLGVWVRLEPVAAMVATSLLAYGAIWPLSFLNSLGWAALALDVLVFALVYLSIAPLLRAINRADLERLGIAIEGAGPLGRLLKPILRYESLVLSILHRPPKR